MSKVIKYTSPYKFKDAQEGAKTRNITLDEMVYNLERRFDDPRAEVSLTDAMKEYHSAIKSETRFQDGAEEQFAYNGYTMLDLNLRRPAYRAFGLQHMPVIYGGGAVETDKGFFFRPTTRGGRLASGENNKVNLVNANYETLEAPILPITLGLSIGIINQLKADTISFDVIGANHEAVRLSYSIELDKFLMVGHRGIDGTNVDGAEMARGLINLKSGDAIISDLETKVYSPALVNKQFETMTTPELIAVMGTEYREFGQEVAYDGNFMPNKWLVGPKVIAALSAPAHITVAGTVYQSQLDYLTAQFRVWARAFEAPEVYIQALPYLDPIGDMTGFDAVLNEDGTNDTGRTILYRQDPYVMRARIALDLTPGALVFDAANNAVRRNYVAFIGTPLLFYPGQVRYIDNGAVVVDGGDDGDDDDDGGSQT